MTMETQYNGTDLEHTHNASIPAQNVDAPISKSVMAAFRRAKKASIAENERARAVVDELRLARGAPRNIKSSVRNIQQTLGDFV